MKCPGFATKNEVYHLNYSEPKCKHEWTGYIVVYCRKCKILKDFFDGFPKK